MSKTKEAFDDFHDEKYTDAEEKFTGIIKDKINDFLKDKLNLKNDPIKKEEE
jgi:hypothetical protein